ncbi:MAG: hypothetical protein QXV32_04030 [Conexivisphaerales archaeon]
MSPASSASKKGHRPEATIVRAVISFGPRNLSRIAKAIQVPVETVRYKLKKQLSSLGFRVTAEPDYSKMGLKLYHATVRFEKERLHLADAIFKLLAERGYLIRAVRLFPKGVYAAEFALPLRTKEICVSVLKHLSDLKVISKFDFADISFMSEYSTNPDFLEIKRVSWKVDWQQVKAQKAAPLPEPSAREKRVDKYDIILLEEFQKDATQHVSDIAEKMHFATPVLGYHYRTHLQRDGLVSAYLTRWLPSTPASKRRGEHVITTRLDFRDLKQNEFARVHEAVAKIPFIMSEMATKKGYAAYMLTPSKELVNMLKYLEEELPDYTPEVNFSDLSDISHLSLPSSLYGDRGWMYNEVQMKQELERIVKG